MSGLVKGFLFAGAVALGACATQQPPQALMQARQVYQQAQSGPAAKYEPQQLKLASETLAQAEEAAKQDPASQRTYDLSYIALRRLETTMVRGNALESQAIRRRADQQLAAANARQEGMQTSEQLKSTQQQLTQAQEQLEAQRRQEEQAQAEAAELQKKLADVAKVSQEERGVVLTLSGSVLFPFGKSTLLPASKRSLDEVASALRRTPQQLTVEGHTDSVGTEQANQVLSERRAKAVVAYLANKGIPRDRMHAEGMGEDQPVADNATAEGRADNRRVEIVLVPNQENAVGGSGPAHTGGSGPSQTGESGPAHTGGSGPSQTGGSGPAPSGPAHTEPHHQ
jgi:outer membrane protein OmpA-like peptidoglycan-associated protein